MPTKILVVDDEPDLREIFMETLQDFYSVTTADDGEEALRLVNSMKPDLIILDLRMPKMDGFHVLSTLKQSPKTSKIPVIVITAYGKLDNILEAERLRASDFLIKPFKSEELLDIVRTVLRRISPFADVMTRFTSHK